MPPRHGGGGVSEGVSEGVVTSSSAAHVESSLQREFHELRAEYSALLEQASRGRSVPEDLAAKLEDVIGRLEGKSGQIAGFHCIPFDRC